MTAPHISIVAVCVFTGLLAIPLLTRADTCPVTKPGHWPNNEVPMPTGPNHAWYGSNLLAAAIPKNGVWTGMGEAKRFADKFWWWRSGYSAKAEPRPNLRISAVRLDGSGENVTVENATNGAGIDGDWDAMLVGMHFPSPGCWEIRGNYNDAQELILVLKVRSNDA